MAWRRIASGDAAGRASKTTVPYSFAARHRAYDTATTGVVKKKNGVTGGAANVDGRAASGDAVDGRRPAHLVADDQQGVAARAVGGGDELYPLGSEVTDIFQRLESRGVIRIRV